MMALAPYFAWVETTRVATIVGQSTLLTGLLSGVHLLGLTLLVGAVVVSSLRLLGLALRDRSVADVAGAARRGILLGLSISVASGLLLVAPRVATASQNGIFQAKILLICAATGFHLAVFRNAGRESSRALASAAAGALGFALWFAVALAGCAFILLE